MFSGGALNNTALIKLLIEEKKLEKIKEKKQSLLVNEINKEIDLVKGEFSNSI